MPPVDDPIQLVVFDLMGTLVADDGLVDGAYGAALAEVGLEVGSAAHASATSRIAQLRGRPTLVVLTDVLGDPADAEEASWAFDDHVLRTLPHVRPVDGAGDVLDELDLRGTSIAVTTSFTPEVRAAVLGHLGWTDRFSAELSAEGRMRGHPAPDLLLRAIVDLRVDSVGQVAIVGDSPADLEAGNRAGAGLVIGVLGGATDRRTLEAAPHTHLVDAVVDVLPILDEPRTVGYRRASDR